MFVCYFLCLPFLLAEAAVYCTLTLQLERYLLLLLLIWIPWYSPLVTSRQHLPVSPFAVHPKHFLFLWTWAVDLAFCCRLAILSALTIQKDVPAGLCFHSLQLLNYNFCASSNHYGIWIILVYDSRGFAATIVGTACQQVDRTGGWLITFCWHIRKKRGNSSGWVYELVKPTPHDVLLCSKSSITSQTASPTGIKCSNVWGYDGELHI